MSSLFSLFGFRPTCGPCCQKNGPEAFEEVDGWSTRVEHGDQPYKIPDDLTEKQCATPHAEGLINGKHGDFSSEQTFNPFNGVDPALQALHDKLSRGADISEDIARDRHATASGVLEYYENATELVRVRLVPFLQEALTAVIFKAEVAVSENLSFSVWTPKGAYNDELEIVAAYLPQRGIKALDINLYSPGQLRAGDVQLEALAARFPQNAVADDVLLEELKIFLGETSITDVGAQILAQRLPAAGLRTLKICFNRTAITDAGLQALTASPCLTQPRACSTLSTLWIELDGCRSITDDGIYSLASLIPTLSLRKLVLVLSDTAVTDAGAKVLADQLQRLSEAGDGLAILQSLEISLWDTVVTPEGHDYLLQAARSVTSEAIVDR